MNNNTPTATPGAPQPEEKPDSPLTVIGIGASAGGLAALRAFFSAVPEQSGLTFVVVVHLSPEHESMLAALLQPYTTMPVRQVTAQVQMQRDCVYVIPPAKQLLVTDSSLALAELDSTRPRQLQIDAFFRSLAENHGDGAAVILSGSGSDGAVGIQTIKEKGGLILVQTPDEAEYDSMPRSAIATGLVDIVGPVAELAPQLVAVKATRAAIQLPTNGEALSAATQQTLTQILAQLRVRTGHDFTGYKQPTLLRRLARRMQLTQLSTLTAYLHHLRQDSAEAEALFRDFLINVTEFFRDYEAWLTLEKSVIPQLFAGKGRNDTVRVWAVGCATGEEAYSVAMLLLEYASELAAPPTIQVFASDLGQTALEAAREGVYAAAIADDLAEARLTRFFTKDNSHYRVRADLREVVLFTQHNLLQDPPFSRLDLILCRNLLIYIQRELQEKIFETFYYALRTNGYLFLGNAESADGATNLFDTVDKRHRLYQRRTISNALPVLPSLPLLPRTIRLPETGAEPPQSGQPPPSEQHHSLLAATNPPSLLIDREYNVLHLSETAGRYLLPPGGLPTVEALKLVRPELQAALRSALFRAFAENKAVSTRPAPVRFNGAPHLVYLLIQPHQLADGQLRALIIFLEDETPLSLEDQRVGYGEQQDGARQQLEAELHHTQAHLQSMREEYETTVEELRAANEELQSTNEEYKSTLEELETSKEELQSINEELQTINQELKTKIDEVTHAHSDVQNLFVATEIATLFLDRDLRVKRYTPSAADLFNLMPPDRGRPIAHLRSNLLYEALEADAQRVLTHLVPIEREAQQSQDGRWFLVRVRPYRTLEDKIDGVVITFVDITTNKANELALRNAKEYAESIVHTIPDALLVLDPALRVQMANDAFYAIFQVNRNATEGRLIYELGNNQWQIPALRTLLEEILPENKVFIGYEVDHTFDGIGHRTMLLNGRRLDHVQLILLAITDISERKRNEQQQDYLFQLGDTLRSLADPVTIERAVTQMALQYFAVDRCYYCTINGDNAIISRDALRGGLASVAGTYPLSNFTLFKKVVDEGRPFVVHDANTAPILDEALRELCRQLQVISFIDVPVIKNGKAVGIFCLAQATPRNWTEAEIRLTVETAERMWTAAERAGVELALRRSEEKYRTLFETMNEGFTVCGVVRDNTGQVIDLRYVELNQALEQQTGLDRQAITGQRLSAVLPQADLARWLPRYTAVADSGEPNTFEEYTELLDRWYSVSVYPRSHEELSMFFRDITDRKRREANLVFLAELSTEFAPFAPADELMASLAEKLAAYLGLSRCDFSMVDETADRITTLYDWRRDAAAPSALGEHAISTFLTPAARQLYAVGQLAIINDTHDDPKISAPPALMDALQIRAVVDSPYLEEGRWKFLISLCRSEATVWRADEIDLIREVTAHIYIRLERARSEEALQHLNATLEQEVDTRTAQVKALASTLAMAEQEERQRISQLLHDNLQQLLYGIQMRMMMLISDVDADDQGQLKNQAQEVYEWLGRAIRTTRQLTVDLNPPVLKEEGLDGALRWLVSQMASVNGLQVDLQVVQPCLLPNVEMRGLLFQIVRELLLNVVKHAQTDHATVVLNSDEQGNCLIQVNDRGRGFDVAAAAAREDRGFGLFSARERLRLFGSQLLITSAPDQGAQITITVPNLTTTAP